MDQQSFSQLLERAVTEPGVISQAYRAFHGYSIGNRLLALQQCGDRDLTPGPIATFLGWKDKGRFVRKGQKAIVLCMPVTCKVKRETTSKTELLTDQPISFTRFIYRPNWFVLSQTDGAEYLAPEIPGWTAARALDILGVTEITFDYLDGNTQGYARRHEIAISPIAVLPHKTRFHELAHVVLGHTTEQETALTDDDLTPRTIREVEAEAVALVCLESLGLPGSTESRGYIQHWNGGHEPITERSAQRIFKAADTILRAGTLVPETEA